ncbi:MAG: class I SAM-dependent methyltransferase [Methanoregula sp.]|jgi:ubiquinone/menaquinone biosynthesis C-methylase UbiE
MTKPRISETDHGIQDDATVDYYDVMQRKMRDDGHLYTPLIIGAGIMHGNALEIGPGPGYLGLEWLKATRNTKLTGIEISEAMIRMARRNAAEYGYLDRVAYIPGTALDLPFPDGSFDAVFSNASLHEWEDPVRVFNEICRVLMVGGRYCITDLRRDMNLLVFWYLKRCVEKQEYLPGLISAHNASYTVNEIPDILSRSALAGAVVTKNPFSIIIAGQKPTG